MRLARPVTHDQGVSRLSDPTVCPGCRGRLDETSTCQSCGLVLTGPLAGRLWGLVLDADAVLEQIRHQQAVGASAQPRTAGLPNAPRSAPAPRRRALRLPAASVPTLLLSLGGLCLLVAVVVFAAVAWGSLSLEVKSTILLGLTGLVAGVAAIVTARGLRGSGETLWVVAAGTLTVDFVAARAGGLAGLGDLSWRGITVLTGITVFGSAVVVTGWSTRRATGRLLGPQAVAVAAALAVTVVTSWAGPPGGLIDAGGADQVIAVVVLACLGALLRTAAPVIAAGLGVLAALTWLVTLAVGVGLAADATDRADWWSGLDGWPLLAAALLTALPAALPATVATISRTPGFPGISREARIAAATASLVAVALLVALPVTDPRTTLLVASAVQAALASIAGFGPRIWAPAAGLLACVGTAFATVTVLGWPLSAGDVSSWTVLPVGVAGVLGGFALLGRRVAPASVAALALAGSMALARGVDGHPLVVAGQLVAVAVALGAVRWAGRIDDRLVYAPLAIAGYAALLALLEAGPSDVLSVVTASMLAATLVGTHHWLRLDRLHQAAVPGCAVLAVWLTCYGMGRAGELVDLSDRSIAVALAVLAGVVMVGARLVSRSVPDRLAIEAAALSVGLAALPIAEEAGAMAMVLTVLGSAGCLVSVLEEDRRLASWGGAAVLGLATLIRVDQHETAPELYTLPAALVLLAFGIWRMRRRPDSDSLESLGSGLVLALLPSLLLCLDEPVSLRGLLLGLGALAVLVQGLVVRWSAPVVAGALASGVLAMRHLTPVAEAVPRWVMLGSVGMLLLVVGVTWEQRRGDARHAVRYLTALR